MSGPFDVPGNQWTPEYAAQVLALTQQAQAQNPDVPGMGQPGIVPMGAPGSLTPPPTAPKPEAADIPAAGGGWQDKLQQMLPMIAAMGYGSDPRTRHMAPMMMQMGQMMRQQRGQQQLADIRGNIAKLQEKGPDAIKKYLTEAVAIPELHPDVSKIAAEQLAKVTERTQARDAVAKLTSRDPKEIIAALPTLMETLGDERAMALYKGLKQENKPQVVQAGDQIWTFDPMSREFTEGPKATPKFNAAVLGGPDVTQELTRVGIDPKDATREQIQEASQAAFDRAESERAKGRASQEKAILGGAALQAKAVEQSTITAAREKAKADVEIANIPVKKEAADDLNKRLALEENQHRLLNEFTPQERAQYVGMGGLKLGYNQVMQLVQQGRADPKFARFSALVNEGKAGAFVDAGKNLTKNEQAIQFGYIPTAEEWSPTQFEEKLKLSHERTKASIDRTADLATTAPASLKDYVSEQRGKRSKTTPGGRRVIE